MAFITFRLSDIRMSPKDRWSAGHAVLGLLLLLATFAAGRASDPGLAMVIPLAYLIYVPICLVIAVVDLATLHPKHFLSVSAGVLVAVSAWIIMPAVNDAADIWSFDARRSEYDSVVEEQRRRQGGRDPVRVIVNFEDRTKLAINNLFYYVIYDEMDNVSDAFQAFWASPKSSTGVIRVGGPTEVRRITGHYYHFYTTN